MLGHHFDHVVAFFALIRAGAVQVPVNVHLRGAGLAHVLSHSEPSLLLADAEFRDVLRDIPLAQSPQTVVWRQAAGARGLAELFAAAAPARAPIPLADSDVRGILYTSGTTGAAKGVVMTDRMYR